MGTSNSKVIPSGVITNEIRKIIDLLDSVEFDNSAIIVDKGDIDLYVDILTREFFPVSKNLSDNKRILVTSDYCFPDSYHIISVVNGKVINVGCREDSV